MILLKTLTLCYFKVIYLVWDSKMFSTKIVKQFFSINTDITFSKTKYIHIICRRTFFVNYPITSNEFQVNKIQLNNTKIWRSIFPIYLFIFQQSKKYVIKI